MTSMKTYVVDNLREWYTIPNDTIGDHAAIADL